MLAAELAAGLAAELPAFKRDGGFVRDGYDAALDDTRALRDESRRVVAALQARYADDDRRPRPENPPQQRARLFRRGDRPARRQAARGAAHRDLHPPADARRPGALYLHRARRTGSQDRQRRRPRARPRTRDFRDAVECGHGAERADQAMRRGAGRARRLQRAGGARRRARLLCGRVVDDSAEFVIEGGRHPVVEQALARDGTPFVANLVRPVAAEGRGCRAHLADHRTEHGGQVDVPAAERTDRDSGADRQLRPGQIRAYWRRRSAVLPRRRRRRSRPRPLDLHGRDGRDRRHPQSGRRPLRWSFSTKSAAAPRPSTACRLPGRPSSTCTTSTNAARCSPRISTSSPCFRRGSSGCTMPPCG